MPDIVPDAPARPVLPDTEVTRRVTLLAELQAALAAMRIQSVLARSHRLVLRSAGNGLDPSGPTDPHLHIFLADGTDVATTDGASYQFASGLAYPVGDPRAAAATRDRQHAPDDYRPVPRQNTPARYQ